MPLWRIFSSPSAFDDTQKEALVADITKIYTDVGLPAFYVVVLFVPLEEGNVYVGGARNANFVRFAIEHIARTLPVPENDLQQLRVKTCRRIDEAIKPHLNKGIQWEYHISETPRDLWKIQGIAPPPSHSQQEKIRAKENRAVPWENGELDSKL